MSKELKYNIILVTILVVMDFLWKMMTLHKDADYQFEHPFYILNITFFICFYGIYTLNYLVFAPKYLGKNKFLWYGVAFVFMIFLFAGVRFVLEEVIFFKITGFHNYGFNDTLFSRYMFDSFYYVLRACLYSSIVFLLFRFIKNKDRIHQLEIENGQAQLTMLKSQLGPHFLFNTLNSFYSELYDTKPETAKDIMKLSQLLWYVTYESEADFMPLNKEITFIKDYLYFFKKRYETNFYVDFKIHGDVGTQQIPSLVLIHFVENLCKHGVINDPDNPAGISITLQDNSLTIKTRNAINMAEKYMDSGIGSINIQKRLNVLLKGEYELKSEENDGMYTSFLKISI
ncbi:MAG: histidine kinase [Cellulophaga sp.]